MKNIYKSMLGALLVGTLVYSADSYALDKTDNYSDVDMVSVKPVQPVDLPYISEINYPAYNANDFTINWVSGVGYIKGSSFELYEQKVYLSQLEEKRSSKDLSRGVESLMPWNLVYTGPSSSFDINKSPGHYRYKVRNCYSANVCTEFLTGILAKVVDSANIDLDLLYPGISDFAVSQLDTFLGMSNGDIYTDRNNSLHQSGFDITYNSSDGPIGVQHQLKSVVIDDLEFNLGRGYLVTSGKYTEIPSCLDLDNHSIVTDPVSLGGHTVTVAETTQDLYELLDLEVSANLSISGNSGDEGNGNGTAYGADAEGRYEFFNEQSSHRRNKNVVFEWSWIDSSSTILSDGGISGIDPIFWDVNAPDFPGNLMLDPSDGSTNNEMNFRDACGDKYVNNISEGARVYVVFTVNEESLSDEEIEDASFSLSGFVGDIFTGGLSASQHTQFTSLMTSHSISTSVFVEGGSYEDSLILELAVEEDVTALTSAVNSFTQALTEDEFVALSKSFSTYLVPNIYINDYTASDVFINFQPYLEKVQDWLNLDYQLYTRCEDIRNSDARIGENTYEYFCSNLNNYMLNNVTYCAEGSQWNNCVYREDAVLSPSGDNLVNFMNANVYDYRTADSHTTGTASINLWVKKPWGTGPSATDSDTVNACLPEPECIINTAIQHTDANNIPGNNAPAGAGIYISDSQYENNSGHGIHSFSPPSANTAACLSSDIEVHTEDGWQHATWAWYYGSQKIYGLCPVQHDFAVF